MKMQLIHYDYLHDAMAHNARYIPQYREHIIREGRAKDVEMRLRWDLLSRSVSSGWICEHLYPYMNDTHIDTALRAIMRKLERAD